MRRDFVYIELSKYVGWKWRLRLEEELGNKNKIPEVEGG